MELNKSDRILFIGDSITDGGRQRHSPYDLGEGYPKMVAGALQAFYPELQLTIFNRGLSGNRVEDLKQRWQEDCIALRPDIVSILIGINDTWRRVGQHDRADGATFKAFEETYRAILQQTKAETGAKIIMLEPFLLHYPEDRKGWRVDLDPRREIIAQLAEEYAVHYLKLDEILNEQAKRAGCQFLTGNDGVHPTLAGHRTIAKTWLKTIGNE